MQLNLRNQNGLGEEWYGGIDTSMIKPGQDLVFDLPGGEPGWNTPYDLITTIAKLAQQGIKAVVPNSSTQACPAGYVRGSGANGAVCVKPGASGQLFPGVDNKTLLIGGVVLVTALILLKGGR